MRQSAISFESKGVTLEGVVAVPEGDVGSLAGVVICHPHPLRGGNMDNNVVLSVAYALTQSGFATLRFNFRGVGNSGGEHTEGKLEAQDALSALDVLKAWSDVDGGRVGVAGYSFGSRVVLENAKIHAKAKAIAVISPALCGGGVHSAKNEQAPGFPYRRGPGQAGPIRIAGTGPGCVFSPSGVPPGGGRGPLLGWL